MRLAILTSVAVVFSAGIAFAQGANNYDFRSPECRPQ